LGYVLEVTVVIRDLTEPDRWVWESLWRGYLEFYETKFDTGSASHLWARILDPASPVRGHVAEFDRQLVGMVHFLQHEDTWRPQPTCYLQDLYVVPESRGAGVGRRLIESVVEVARAQGCSGVYWLTAEDNVPGRILYDKLTGGTSGFIHYEIES
jgi:GNAT superfamily N-acetyltransferase